jgi:hypothetical protein
MLPDRVMRGKEGSELQARHGVLSGFDFLFVEAVRLRAGACERNRPVSRVAECRHADVFSLLSQAERGADRRDSVIPFPTSGRRIHEAVASSVRHDRISAICARRPCRLPVLFAALDRIWIASGANVPRICTKLRQRG